MRPVALDYKRHDLYNILSQHNYLVGTAIPLLETINQKNVVSPRKINYCLLPCVSSVFKEH